MVVCMTKVITAEADSYYFAIRQDQEEKAKLLVPTKISSHALFKKPVTSASQYVLLFEFNFRTDFL